MYNHSYSFDPDICLHIHTTEFTVRLPNQAGRNNNPYNPKFVVNTWKFLDQINNKKNPHYIKFLCQAKFAPV